MMPGCTCEPCRMLDSWKAENPGSADATEEALLDLWWSTHCVRCGKGVKFKAWTADAICKRCKREIDEP